MFEIQVPADSGAGDAHRRQRRKRQMAPVVDTYATEHKLRHSDPLASPCGGSHFISTILPRMMRKSIAAL